MKKKVLLMLSLFSLVGCATNVPSAPSSSPETVDQSQYEPIEVDACDMTPTRKPNAKVDIGFGDREYWAYTNEYSQLVYVTADEIILQDEANEPVNADGRYCDRQAPVEGTESRTLDCGHVIFDAGGGVGNAYNITPQQSTLNRHGNQAYMEKTIRTAIQEGKRVTDFEAVITYPNTQTQIPSHYKYTYKIDGLTVVDEFDNVDPDSVPVAGETAPNETVDPATDNAEVAEETHYILNTNSKKIHRADCESVGKMSENNKEEYHGNIYNLINQGYEPCGICKPAN